MLPLDKTETITTQTKYRFDDFFAGMPAYYVRIEADQDCKLMITQMDGGTFQYSRGIRRNIPLDLVSYKIQSILVIPSTSTEIWIHATTQEQERPEETI